MSRLTQSVVWGGNIAGEPGEKLLDEGQVRGIRRLLFVLSLICFFAFIGTRVASHIPGYGVIRSCLGITSGLSIGLGCLLVLVKVPKVPRLAGYAALAASLLAVASELVKLTALLQIADPALVARLSDLFAFLCVLIFVFLLCLLNVALFEMAVQRMALVRESRRLSESRETQQQTERRYAAIFDNASDGIALVSRTGVILEVNSGACELLGYSREELTGKLLTEITRLDTFLNMNQDLPQTLVETLEEGRGRLFDVVVCTKGGEERSVEFSASAMPEGEILVLARDKTQKRDLEEQINRMQKMESIGRLAGGVAHDFNNVLTPILGYTEMLLAECPDGHPWRSDLAEISRAAEHARNLTRQLLALSRKQRLNMQPVDLSQVMQGFENVLRRTIHEDVEITFQLSAAPATIRADAYQLEQVLMNLCINAQDAMPRGGHLTVETESVHLDDAYAYEHPGTSPGPHVMLAITDTGVGMDTETQSKVFEPFFTTKNQGTGLGLATVYGIIKQHGGSIWVYSEVGRGTTFKLYFPIIPPVVAPAGETHFGSSQKTGRETLVVVEDNDAVRDMVRSALEKSGYKVLCASNGLEGLALLEQCSDLVDLIVTDVIMPKMNGHELAKAVQRLYPKIKILYMSGYSETVISRHGVIQEGGDFIQKPVSVKKMLDKVRDVLDRPSPVAGV